MEQGNFYRHSGELSAGGFILAIVAGTVGVAAAATIYAALVLYLPLAGFITFLLAAGFGIAAGFVAGTAQKWGKLRNDAVSMLLAAVFAAEAVYVSWVAWTTLLLWRSDVEATVASVAPPHALWALIGEINQVGAWSLRGFTPTGGFLWTLWAIEALLVFGMAFFLCLGMTAIPFCERCELWCELEEDVARFAACDDERIRHEGASQPLELLGSLGRPEVKDESWLRADLYSCPRCRDTHTLSLSSVTVSHDGGERHETASEVLRELIVPTSVAEGVRRLA